MSSDLVRAPGPAGGVAADPADPAAPALDEFGDGRPAGDPAGRPGLAERVRAGRQQVQRQAQRLLRRGLRIWRSSLQVRIGAITMLVAGAVVVVVSVVLFRQISDQLIGVKQRAAVDQSLTGVYYAQTQVSGIASGDSASIRSTLSRTVTALRSQGGAAGDFEVVMVYRTGTQETPYYTQAGVYPALPRDLRAEVARGAQAYRYATVPDGSGDPVPTLLVGAPVPSDGDGGDAVELYFAFPLDQERESLQGVRSTVAISAIALTLFVVGIGVLVTRLVVDPVRRAASGAQRLAEGHLEDRLAVRGEDDLARLATSFNAMADSLQQQITQLEGLSQLQQRFTSDVSHELRTPLTTVQMAAAVLHDARGEFDPAVARSAELLQAELNRFEVLLSDLLEISRYDAGAAVLDAEPQDLGPVVLRVVDGMSTLAARLGSPLLVRLPEGSVVAEVDGRRVERVLRNLVGNAIEHGAGRPVEITLGASETAVAITVRDHGVGLSAEDAQHVFDRFWRADPARVRSVGGSGLGLSISLEDARLHGGWLQVWGAPGEGAQFRLTLPLAAGVPLTGSPLPLRPAGWRAAQGRAAVPVGGDAPAAGDQA